jgi:preprotein translocase subunit SecG
MVTLLMTLFVILCFLLILIVLLQQGKGDMGLGGLGGGSQMLFGGSGGQEFFEKITWTMITLFILGALGLTILKNKTTLTTRVSKTAASFKQKQIPKPAPQKTTQNQDKK